MKVGVVGLGYVGLPLLVEAAKSGLEAIGFDVNPAKVAAINSGENYIEDVNSADLAALAAEGRLRATTDWDRAAECDCISICVPTPLRKTKDPDVSFIIDSARELAQRRRKGQLIILESTTYPGTTEELIQPEFSADGWEVGRDYFLAFSPERVDPGNPQYKTRNIPKIVGGVTAECSRRAVEYYARIFDTVIPVSSSRAAEMVKLLENTFRSVNIGLVNEVAIMCDRLNVNVWEVIEAASTKPFGFMPFYPGPGLGGHCIPIDPHYLAWKLKTLNYTARFIELASEVNASMPHFVLDKVVRGLNDQGRAVRSSRIVLIGVAYKPNVSDMRESPALDLLTLLKDLGASLSYHDPHVPTLGDEFPGLASEPLTHALMKGCHCAIIVTHHSGLDYQLVLDHAPLVIDTRNATRGLTGNAQLLRL